MRPSPESPPMEALISPARIYVMLPQAETEKPVLSRASVFFDVLRLKVITAGYFTNNPRYDFRINRTH